MASIARTYDCSPPAISYIVSRSRVRDTADDSVTEPSEPRLVKGQASDAHAAKVSRKSRGSDETPESHRQSETSAPIWSADAEPQSIASPLPNEPIPAPDLRKEPMSRKNHAMAEGNGQGVLPGPLGAAAAPNGEQRRTLHLSPSQDDHRSDASRDPARGPDITGSTAHQPFTPGPAPYAPNLNGGAAAQTTGSQRTKEGGAFIDRALRERVDGDITAFLAAFDAALADDTPDSRTALREATDRLLRAGARTRIELERLEARVPLPPRDNGGRAAPAWRPR